MALHEKKGNLHARKGQGKRNNNNNINNNTFSSSSRRGDIQGTDPGGCEFFTAITVRNTKWRRHEGKIHEASTRHTANSTAK